MQRFRPASGQVPTVLRSMQRSFLPPAPASSSLVERLLPATRLAARPLATTGTRRPALFGSSTTPLLSSVRSGVAWRVGGATAVSLARRPFGPALRRNVVQQATQPGASPTVAAATWHEVPTSMKVWIAGCTATVFGIVVVGGLTRLTESGLSMVDWGVLQMKPPITQEEWEAEFDKYKQFPEYKKLNSKMTVEEFKSIYYYEWAHRNLGRFLGVVYTLPLLYFTARGHVRGPLRTRLYAIAVGIGLQGLLGWYMVKSGLVEKDHPRVSQYRLAAHLGSAFVLYTAMLWTTFDFVLTPLTSAARLTTSSASAAAAAVAASAPTVLKLQARMRKYAHGVAGLVFLTAISGAFVAGLDAGLIYTDFPYMGGQLVPNEILDLNPKWRNFTENDVTVQFQHRILGITTFSSIAALWLWARKVPLPPRARTAVNALLGVASLQVSLGIATLYTLVMTHVAASHQAGSLTLLSIATWLMHELKRLPK